MKEKTTRLVVDLDNTICVTHNKDYANSTPRDDIISTLKSYNERGFQIIIHTSRNMNTHCNNIGKINASTLPIIVDWLNRHDVPFDEIFIGKPWCGDDGFYIDDRAVRPSEFLRHSLDEINRLLDLEK